MAPQNQKYSHLIIKEGDIEIVKYDPQGRTKPVSRNFGTHGQLLLDGMKHIITKHSTVTSSLGTNKVTFEIKLHESQKFQDKNRGSSGSTYTAPADGWANVIVTASMAKIMHPNILESSGDTTTSTTELYGLILPVSKGSTFRVDYSNLTKTWLFHFVYAVGSEPTT